VDNSKNKTLALQGIHSLLIVCDPGLIFQKAKMILKIFISPHPEPSLLPGRIKGAAGDHEF
jgi:hypothetical protein